MSVTINDGDVISVIGPSGTGKSTLLRCINLLEKPTSGQIFLNGEEITAHGYDVRKARRRMGMIFQSFNLFGHLTVIENVMLAQTDLLGRSRQEAYDTGMPLLNRLGMGEKALSYPDELSGGQKQRVAIARALAMDPEIILFDEPTSALDPTMIERVQTVIQDLAASGKTMMIVTHEMAFAKAVSNRVFYMDQGGIYEDGTPEQIFDRPSRELTRRFIKKLRILEFVIDSRAYDFIGAGVEIDRYCLQKGLGTRDKYLVRLAFEELVQQILIPRMKEPHIRVQIECSEEENALVMTVSYGGGRFDPRDTDNILSLTALKSASKEISYEFEADEEKPNRVRIVIRNT